MADIELVIKIPEELYKEQLDSDWAENIIIHDAIVNGIPLSKRHGKLIDINDIKPMSYIVDGGEYYGDYKVIDWEDIEKASAIIEADKGDAE